MQVVIPMSGFGERFKKAGYKVPKPLIEVEGMPIIAHVINMFPDETKFIFICNEEHMANPDYKMQEILEKYCPTGKIITIASHKLGPVYAVLQAENEISDDEETIVNYCDFTCDWDYKHFKEWLALVKPDGCIPAYRGFHPHSLGSTYYAYMQEEGLWLKDIQEKQPYTDAPMNEFASSGTYYFTSGKLLKKFFKQTMQENLMVNNEYYVSMVYKPMLSEKCQIAVYELNHFMQWGTPDDLHEYNTWSKAFKGLANRKADKMLYDGSFLLPMVGLGSRFVKAGYLNSKPLIDVSGAPMYYQAVSCLPRMQEEIFVLREDTKDVDTLNTHIKNHFMNGKVIVTQEVTNGQATSCMLAQGDLDEDKPLLISACDNGVLYSQNEYQELMEKSEYDVLVWGMSGYPNAKRYPEMYGWVDTEANSKKIRQVSVKKVVGDPSKTPIIIGTFWFKKAAIFFEAYEKLLQQKDMVNGEYYVDSCINHAIDLGYCCAVFDVESYLCWGTPADLQSFEYWQGCFHYWKYHSYSIENDNMVPAEFRDKLVHKYKMNRSALPYGITENV